MDVRAHAQAMEQVGAGILQVAAAEERKLDAQLKDMENLGRKCLSLLSNHRIVLNYICFADEDDFEALRQKRRLNLQKKMKMEQDWKQLGHGR